MYASVYSERNPDPTRGAAFGDPESGSVTRTAGARHWAGLVFIDCDCLVLGT